MEIKIIARYQKTSFITALSSFNVSNARLLVTVHLVHVSSSDTGAGHVSPGSPMSPVTPGSGLGPVETLVSGGHAAGCNCYNAGKLTPRT